MADKEQATYRQTFAIFSGTGYDVRGCGLSRDDASALIDLLFEGHNIVPIVRELDGVVARNPKQRSTKPRPRSERGRSSKPRPVKVQDSGRSTWRITIPAAIARQLDPDVTYEAFLTPDGLLFKPLPKESDVGSSG